jgi:formylglycine-generating enzyme required for sulfatase activity/tRNA A-37 threonylcarbamoyl transferase component Bud32
MDGRGQQAGEDDAQSDAPLTDQTTFSPAVQDILAALRRSAGEVGSPPVNDGLTPPGGLTPGTLIVNYRIVRHLGRGGMADVYEAVQVALKRRVALKVMREDPARPDLGQRFLREARAMIQVRHPNITAILDAGQVDGLLYLALEFVDGGDVASAVKRQGRLPLAEALRIMCACAEGLITVHTAGLVHRDLKPANIFLTSAGQPKVGDFGLARQVSGGDRLTVTGASWGTPSFMAPEQIVGAADVDHRADIYALGATLYAVLTGREPFSDATAYMVTFKAMTEDVPDPREIVPDLPASVVAVIRMATNRDRDRRYASMRTLLEDLRRIEQQQGLLHASEVGLVRAGGSTPVARGASAAPAPGTATVRAAPRTVALPMAPAKPRSYRWMVVLGALVIAAVWGLMSGSQATPIPIPAWAHDHGRDARGLWVRVVVGEESTRLRYCPPGTFRMGSPPDEPGRQGDEQLHQVVLSTGFWMQESECPQAFFEAVSGRNPSRFLGDDLPVERVALAEVEAFCEALQRKGIPARLPSEAQWEYACRAGSQASYASGAVLSKEAWVARGGLLAAWGEQTDPSAALEAALRYCDEHPDEAELRPRPVARAASNGFGLHDLHGNVAEWCVDRWDGRSPAGVADSRDPLGQTGEFAVVRGGSWLHPQAVARSAARMAVAPTQRQAWLGFRFIVPAAASAQ